MDTHNLIQMNRYCNDFHDNEKVIFCKIDFIEYEFEKLKSKKGDCVLIVANGDKTFDDKLLSICPNNVKHIFATNTTCNNEKVTPIPIGVEMDILPTREGHGFINEGIFGKKKYLITPSLLPVHEKKEKLLSNFRVNTNFSFRSKVKSLCGITDHIDCYEEISFEDFGKYAKSYMGVISPRGNGIECIRTYETLYLGGIPIVVGNVNEYNSIYNNIYVNLPIVFIDDYKKLMNFDFLKKEIEKVKDKSTETLSYEYWKELIKNKIKNL